MMQESSTPQTCPTSTLSAAASLVSLFLSQGNDLDLLTKEARSFMKSADWLKPGTLNIFCLRTCRGYSLTKGGKLSSLPRLPFPMRSATMESKKEECNGLGEFVNTICVPEMLIKLRQGLGRLIRCETDTGLISILDTRATTGKYADKVGNVLAKYTKAETLDEVEAFFREVKSPAYFEV